MSNVLHLPARSRTARPARGPLAALCRDVFRACRELLAASDHQAIDDATLRDLGMTRSELGSYAAEASGRAELTRLRVIASRRHDRQGALE